MSLSFHFGKPGTGMSLYAPPAAVNDAALSSGSGQVRAVGGAPFQTLEEVFASLPPGEFVGDVYRVFEAKAVRAVSVDWVNLESGLSEHHVDSGRKVRDSVLVDSKLYASLVFDLVQLPHVLEFKVFKQGVGVGAFRLSVCRDSESLFSVQVNDGEHVDRRFVVPLVQLRKALANEFLCLEGVCLGVRVKFHRESSSLFRSQCFRKAHFGIGRAGRVPLKKSNLDQFGKLVQKGLTVSYHGVRGRVAKVSRGACCVEYMHFTGRPTGSCEWLDCELVQVVS